MIFQGLRHFFDVSLHFSVVRLTLEANKKVFPLCYILCNKEKYACIHSHEIFMKAVLWKRLPCPSPSFIAYFFEEEEESKFSNFKDRKRRSGKSRLIFLDVALGRWRRRSWLVGWKKAAAATTIINYIFALRAVRYVDKGS